MKDNHSNKQKKVLFWSLVLFVMAVILFFRIVGVPSFDNTISEEETKNSLNWQSFTEKFSSIVEDFNDDWEETKDKNSEVKNIFVENEENSTSTKAIDVEESETQEEDEDNSVEYMPNNYQDIEKTKEEMEELIEKFNNINNCPKWINCMPNIGSGEKNNCVIPIGCEDITQIAY